jgi:hypothetical protein
LVVVFELPKRFVLAAVALPKALVVVALGFPNASVAEALVSARSIVAVRPNKLPDV